jgi:protein-tyrosine phosphatase
VVATPHFYPHRDTVGAFLASRDHAVRKLLALGIPAGMQVLVGAEVLVSVGLEDMEGLERLCVQGTNVILLEMPFTHWGEALVDTVLAIRDRGLCPVLAHIDRYDPHDVARLLSVGILAQINAAALAGFFKARKMRPYLAGERVVALGSDLHGTSRTACRNFSKMRKKLGARANEIFARAEKLLESAVPLGTQGQPPAKEPETLLV